MDWFDDPPETALAEVMPAKMTREQKADMVLDGIQDRIYEESLSVIDDGLKFADVDISDLEDGQPPPEKWVKELGLEKAKRRARVARYCLMPKKDAPIAISLAASTAAAIANARAKTNQGPKTLNVQVVQISQPLPPLEVVEVDK
jgi:hypothetical protein